MKEKNEAKKELEKKDDPNLLQLPKQIGISDTGMERLVQDNVITKAERATHDFVTGVLAKTDYAKQARYLYPGLLVRQGWKAGEKVQKQEILPAFLKHVKIGKRKEVKK